MYVKIFDCDIFIDSHEIKIEDSHGSSAMSCDTKSFHSNNVKNVIESYLVPDIYLKKYFIHSSAIYVVD